MLTLEMGAILTGTFEQKARLFLTLSVFADVFQGVEWFPAQNKCPVLKEAIAYMECKVVSRMETADHWITYAQVTNGEVMDADERTAVHRRKVGNYY